MADEVAWLIELTGERSPTYWGRVHGDDHLVFWTEEVNDAVRFCRKQDAEAIIEDIGWTRAVAVEHAWVDLRIPEST